MCWETRKGLESNGIKVHVVLSDQTASGTKELQELNAGSKGQTKGFSMLATNCVILCDIWPGVKVFEPVLMATLKRWDWKKRGWDLLSHVCVLAQPLCKVGIIKTKNSPASKKGGAYCCESLVWVIDLWVWRFIKHQNSCYEAAIIFCPNNHVVRHLRSKVIYHDWCSCRCLANTWKLSQVHCIC